MEADRLMVSKRDELRKLLADVFLLTPEEIDLDMERKSVNTWDSLGVVALAVGVEETFGYHMTPEEATGLKSIPELLTLLKSKGVYIDG